MNDFETIMNGQLCLIGDAMRLDERELLLRHMAERIICQLEECGERGAVHIRKLTNACLDAERKL